VQLHKAGSTVIEGGADFLTPAPQSSHQQPGNSRLFSRPYLSPKFFFFFPFFFRLFFFLPFLNFVTGTKVTGKSFVKVENAVTDRCLSQKL